MISAKRLVQLAKKWQRMAALGRKRIMAAPKETEECCTSVAVKGHCVMYTADGRRFEVPLAYLGTVVFSELLRMSQEEFGFMSDGRIVLPCDAEEMNYAMSLLKRNPSVEVVNALILCLATALVIWCQLLESTSKFAACSFLEKSHMSSAVVL